MSRGYGRSAGPGDAFTNNVGIGAAVGVGAYVVNYILTYLMVSIDGAQSGDVAMWKLVGLVHYAAHFVETSISMSSPLLSFSMSMNLLDTASMSQEMSGQMGGASGGVSSSSGGMTNLTSTFPAFVYHLVPIIVLMVAGLLVVSQARERLETPGAAAVGASITVGYLLLSVVGTFLFEISRSASQGGMEASLTMKPDLVTAVLVAGIVFPALFGAIGGVVANEA